MKQSHHQLSLSIAVSPESAWKIIGGADGVDQWFAPVIACRVEGNKRYCETADGAFSEDILEVNHDTRVFKYAIPNQNLLPVSNIIGSMQVSDAPNGHAIVSWSWSFEVEAAVETDAKEALNTMGNMGIKGIESVIKTQEATASIH